MSKWIIFNPGVEGFEPISGVTHLPKIPGQDPEDIKEIWVCADTYQHYKDILEGRVVDDKGIKILLSKIWDKF